MPRFSTTSSPRYTETEDPLSQMCRALRNTRTDTSAASRCCCFTNRSPCQCILEANIFHISCGRYSWSSKLAALLQSFRPSSLSQSCLEATMSRCCEYARHKRKLFNNRRTLLRNGLLSVDGSETISKALSIHTFSSPVANSEIAPLQPF